MSYENFLILKKLRNVDINLHIFRNRPEDAISVRISDGVSTNLIELLNNVR